MQESVEQFGWSGCCDCWSLKSFWCVLSDEGNKHAEMVENPNWKILTIPIFYWGLSNQGACLSDLPRRSLSDVAVATRPWIPDCIMLESRWRQQIRFACLDLSVLLQCWSQEVCEFFRSRGPLECWTGAWDFCRLHCWRSFHWGGAVWQTNTDKHPLFRRSKCKSSNGNLTNNIFRLLGKMNPPTF